MALVVIGGVAAGLSAAARARRIDPETRRSRFSKRARSISYGACGLPYFVEGRVRDARQLIVYTPEYFRKERNIEVRTGARVVSISHPRREVQLESGERVPLRATGDRDWRALRQPGHRGCRSAARLHSAHHRRCRAHARVFFANGARSAPW